MGLLVLDVLIIVEVVPDVVSDCDVGSEIDFRRVESRLVEVAHNAAAVQVVSPYCLFVADQREGIDDDGQNQGEEDLVDQHHIHILEHLEEVDTGDLGTTAQEQEAHKSTHCLVSGHKDKSKALAEGTTVSIGLFFEVEEHEDAEEVLDENEGDDGEDELDLGPPDRHEQVF